MNAASPCLLQQSIRFGLVGGLATAVHAGSYAASIEVLETSPLLANSAAFVIAFFVSFAGHLQWTFSDYSRSASGHAQLSALARFLVTAIAGFCMNTAAVLLLVGILDANPLMAVLPMITITPISTFLLSRHWVFPTAAR